MRIGRELVAVGGEQLVAVVEIEGGVVEVPQPRQEGGCFVVEQKEVVEMPEVEW